MKFNKWTLGLAAVGVVSLTSATQADEAKMSMVNTALSSTTLSGYVDTSIQYNPTGGGKTAPVSFNGGKSNGFNLNVVDLALDHPEDESPWAAGYHVELWFGPDASTLATSTVNSFAANYAGTGVTGTAIGTDYAIRQAYITLRTPIGNGIDWKLGVFDTIIGYESTSDMLNPNYTHSYGYSIEPVTHTGLLATYAFTSELSVSAGIADSKGGIVNDRTTQALGGYADSFKSYMASIAYTAPQSWGWAAGSTLSGGVVTGTYSFGNDATTSWYLGASMATPITALKVGASFDYQETYDNNQGNPSPWAAALYATYQATPKLSFNSRAELAKPALAAIPNGGSGAKGTVFALTETVEYDMWANVLTRAEIRWDSTAHNDFGGSTANPNTGDQRNAVMLALQAIYKF